MNIYEDIIINYRLATIQDIKKIEKLFESCVSEMRNNGIEQWDEIYPAKGDFYEDILEYGMYVGCLKEEIVAAYTINQEFDEAYFGQEIDWKIPFEDSLTIHRLCVSPKMQGKGIGKRTLEDAELRIKGMGYRCVKLDAFSLNPIALSIYSKKGYKRMGSVNWRKGLFYLFEREI